MQTGITANSGHFGKIDRLALGLSALCGVHCVATSALLALGVVASIGGLLASPLIHEVGLAVAILLGAVALGVGMARHRRKLPFAIGVIGLGIMAGGLVMPHGPLEAVVTLAGLAVLSAAHILNARRLHCLPVTGSAGNCRPGS